MELTSSAFAPGAPIPRRYSCEGEDVSPPLGWRDVPGAAVSLGLIVDDPDAPGGTFTHWLAWGMAPDTQQLAEAEHPPGEGRNDFGQVGYRGPCPPAGHGEHRYFFRLYALDRELTVRAGGGRRDVERAMKGCVLEVAELVGTYRR